MSYSNNLPAIVTSRETNPYNINALNTTIGPKDGSPVASFKPVQSEMTAFYLEANRTQNPKVFHYIKVSLL